MVKHIFLAFIAQNRDGNTAIFWPKPCVNPFGKMSILRIIELLVVIAKKGIFSFWNMVKHTFLAYIAQKKR